MGSTTVILLMWSDLYKTATSHPKKSDDFSGNPGAKKKMIVNSMIRRIDVYTGYKLKIEFDFDLRQFFFGIDDIINDLTVA